VESAALHQVADEQVLRLTTTGRQTGLPCETEIWSIVRRDDIYLFAETGESAGWVKNVRRNPNVSLWIEELRINATARIFDRRGDREHWNEVCAIADQNTDGATSWRSKLRADS
jgi:deazaflavin-dependent oxidoreductase (nitroreductase family)